MALPYQHRQYSNFSPRFSPAGTLKRLIPPGPESDASGLEALVLERGV
ncbi:hypothetical protein [Arthrobacter sp. W4I7]|nr:hypothetical protein [Arthrobacter sp. W4I7]